MSDPGQSIARRIACSPERFPIRGPRGTLISLMAAVALAGCPSTPPVQQEEETHRAQFMSAMAELNTGACTPGEQYQQEDLGQPVEISAGADGVLQTELVVRIRERCVPVWVQPPTPEGGEAPPPRWEMQTLNLRTYGFPKDPDVPITEADADDPNSPKIAWSAPGPTFLMHPATSPGSDDGTHFKMRLYNRMPHDPNPGACEPNFKCDPNVAGECSTKPPGGSEPQVPNQVVGDQVVEPPNCFHGNSSTNFHFHGFHVSPALGQDNVGLELRPPLPGDVAEGDMPSHGPHGEHGTVRYGQFDFDVDPLRYTQPPGTHWYHAHKHGSTALQVLNGLVGTFKIRGEFDEQLDSYFEKEGGSQLVDRLMVVQQLQEKQPGLGGADQTGSVLVNGQANPIVRMAKNEIQRWRFVGATMQASAALRVGFPDVPGQESPVVRQIAMDGVQFSPDNYECQPFLNNPDCTKAADDSDFNELTAFQLSPGNRVDVLVQAPSTAGTHCMVMDMTTVLDPVAAEKIGAAMAQKASVSAGSCGLDPNTNLGPLFTLVVEDREKAMTFPTTSQFPPLASYLADIPEVTDPSLEKDVFYEMINQGSLPTTQFWITQQKYNPECANETLTIDEPQHWTLWNNSGKIAHPFHIHQNPFQLLSQSDRTPNGYKFPVWRDTLAIPKTKSGQNLAPNSNPEDPNNPWGQAELVYVAKEFTGMFVNHCHILGHEDRGMMHNTQSVCAEGDWATTGPVPPGATCDAEGFCPGDCQDGKREASMKLCADPPPQQSDWPKAYGVP